MKTETKVQHTSGPWEITYSRDGKVALINKGRIAEVELDDNQDGEANARLIAAAPEILKALEGLAAYFKYMVKDPQFKEYVDAIDAINKAKGL